MDNFSKGKKFGGGGNRGKKFGGGGHSFGGDRGGNRGFGGGGGRGFGGGDRGGNKNFGGGGRDGSRPEMHKAVCTECGNNCEVPFRPTGDKPIFCSDCFKNKGGDNSRNSRDGGGRSFGDRNSKPRFDDRRSNQSDGGKDSINYKAQFEMLNSKLDNILSALSPSVSKEVQTAETKSKGSQKVLKKVVDKVALKKTLSKAIDKKSVTSKKVGVKKNSKEKKK